MQTVYTVKKQLQHLFCLSSHFSSIDASAHLPLLPLPFFFSLLDTRSFSFHCFVLFSSLSLFSSLCCFFLIFALPFAPPPPHCFRPLSLSLFLYRTSLSHGLLLLLTFLLSLLSPSSSSFLPSAAVSLSRGFPSASNTS